MTNLCQPCPAPLPCAPWTGPPPPPALRAPEVSLVTSFRTPPAQSAPAGPAFWSDFVCKCRLAWDVFFPAPPANLPLSPAGAVRNRLQMILVSDRQADAGMTLSTVLQTVAARAWALAVHREKGVPRKAQRRASVLLASRSGLDLPTLLKIKDQSLAALAQSNGWANLAELELQVATQKANGERVKLRLPLSQMQDMSLLRDAEDYDLEYYDDDDYFEDEEDHSVGAGLSNTADEDGFYQYQRPAGKSGGHGVGWSEIPRYAFKVPGGWGEVPVSIADLGGTEIDLRYSSREQGEVTVVVAPVMRFADIGFNAKFGKPVEDEDILETEVTKKDGLSYYQWAVKPFRLVTATATGNRMFILSVAASSRQWRKHESDLRSIARSFVVPDAAQSA
ncbi:hypothetical protein QJQ45_002369 [Haematococcus lacustris]|nr:hypothetical protein QJQ45_002369 [Haematococcus lacustris]